MNFNINSEQKLNYGIENIISYELCKKSSFINVARFYNKHKKYNLAIKNYKKAIENNNDVEAMYELAMLYQEKMYRDKSKRIVRFYKNDKGKYIPDLTFEEKNKKNNDDDEKCRDGNSSSDDCNDRSEKGYEKYFNVKYYKMAIQNNHALAMYKLADFFHSQSEYDIAIKYYTMAVEHNVVPAMCPLARLHFKFCNNELAEKYYKMALENNDYDAAIMLSEIYEERRDDDMYEKYLILSIQKNANVYEACSSLADLYIKQHKYDLAEKYKKMKK